VIPLLDEADSLEELHRRIDEALTARGLSFEVIYIDDGSRDRSLEVLEAMAGRDDRVRVVSFRRNYGKSAALAEGFARVRGTYVATLDADLQDDPGELPAMIDDLAGGYDLVSGWKRERQDPKSKRYPSKLFNLVVRTMSGVPLHDMNCGLKVYRREVVQELPVYGEFHRFLPVLAHWQGFRVTERVVQHEARRYGRSKFGPIRFVNGFLDFLSVMFLTRSQKSPLHVFGGMALVLLMVGIAITLYMFGIWIADGALRARPLFIAGMVFLILGIQFVSIGLLGEMLAFHHRRRDYGIKREIP
jgi:glycosyltransferase involved in cell wall biosynthesis